MKAETGRLSPFMRPMGSMISVTIFTSSGRPACAEPAGSSGASAQEAGTSILRYAVAPASIARWFMSTMSWPFFRYDFVAASFM